MSAEGFQLLEGTDGKDALHMLAQHSGPVDLVVTDIRMPQMDGITLARSVNDMYPKTPVVYISGYPFDLEEERTRITSACAFVAKPFTRKTLLEAVHKCIRPAENKAGAGI